METQTAAYWIKHLDLRRHPEGGYYKEIFRSQQKVLQAGSRKTKHACTSIYYLLEADDYSGFHRIASDEIWYFHKGSPLHIYVINEQGVCAALELSDNPSGSLSLAVRAGLWFAVEVTSNEGFTLVSCAVAPGFEFAEFEMAQKEKMVVLYPQHAALFERLCRC